MSDDEKAYEAKEKHADEADAWEEYIFRDELNSQIQDLRDERDELQRRLEAGARYAEITDWHIEVARNNENVAVARAERAETALARVWSLCAALRRLGSGTSIILNSDGHASALTVQSVASDFEDAIETALSHATDLTRIMEQ